VAPAVDDVCYLFCTLGGGGGSCVCGAGRGRPGHRGSGTSVPVEIGGEPGRDGNGPGGFAGEDEVACNGGFDTIAVDRLRAFARVCDVGY